VQAVDSDRSDGGEAAARAHAVAAYAQEVAALGRQIAMPFVAVSADLSSPDPMVDSEGRPFAETLFRWLDPSVEYWKDRSFALKAPFVLAARFLAEPFYFAHGQLATWRPSGALRMIEAARSAADHGIGSAIIAPTHLSGGVIGMVVWASPTTELDVPATFDRWADRLHASALRFMSAYHDARGKLPSPGISQLTRREIQCLKWASVGKTDQTIGELLAISEPTVRFHLRNAAAKLGVCGRSQAVREAAALGYIGLGHNPARRA
jgi:DNA-binding CsgD family transcriptional regulator